MAAARDAETRPETQQKKSGSVPVFANRTQDKLLTVPGRRGRSYLSVFQAGACPSIISGLVPVISLVLV